jgi:hypothetical protein
LQRAAFGRKDTLSDAQVWECAVAEAQKVSIKIDDSFTGPVCDFSVGFLKSAEDGQVRLPAGTGTFAQLGKTYGIVTAGHVLKKLKQGTIGLVRFPSIEPALQNYRLNLDHTERVVLWNGKDAEAPDLAFLKIPELDASNLQAQGSVFYNLGRERNFSASKPNHRMAKAYAVVGVVGEWTEEGPAMQAKGKKLIVGGLFGAAKNRHEFKEGETDLVEVAVDYEAGPKIPKSYGGVSGGALWELHVELDEEEKVVSVNKKLHGVAFRQSEDHSLIVSNAAPSIEALEKAIAAEWPEDK